MPFFSNLFKRDASSKSRKNVAPGKDVVQLKPRWEEAWSRKEVSPEEVQELIHECSQEMKSRALDMPFLLLPFRPGSDPVGSKSFIRNFFKIQYNGTFRENKQAVQQELRLMDPLVLCSIMKWCWNRLPGGVVSWETYELFRTGEIDASMAKNAFTVFIPMSTESEARKKIVFDFFDLLAAIAARGKTNGLGGRKLSRMAGWWAFEHSDNGKGFEGGYKSWATAADATSHLFFAYLRSLSPDATGGVSGISQLPRSLQALLSQTEYPPETPTLMLQQTPRVVMIVNTVSPTPFALLRRARNFEYRDDDEALQKFSAYEDPVQTLTEECKRVLNSISSINQSTVPNNDTAGQPVQEGAWSRFEDMGFSGLAESPKSPGDLASSTDNNGIRSAGDSKIDDGGRPTTPSWADFLSSGFPSDRSPSLLPPDKALPLPLSEQARGHSSQSHVRPGLHEDLEPGELASIHSFDLDETFWWVWMTSLAGEETPERKAVFGRCALIETQISGAHWFVIEEQIKGASPGQDEGVYLAEKKSRFSWTKRGRLGRRKTIVKKPDNKALTEEPYNRAATATPSSRIAPDQHRKIKETAARLKDQNLKGSGNAQRRGRMDDSASQKTNSVMTLQPAILSEAAPAMKWAKDFDKEVTRATYLGDPVAGTGSSTNLTIPRSNAAFSNYAGSPTALRRELSNRELPSLPKEASAPASPMQRKPVRSPSPPATPPRAFSPEMSPEPEFPAALEEKPKLDNSAQHPAHRPSASPEPTMNSNMDKQNKTESSGGLKKFWGRKQKPSPSTPEKAAPVVVEEPPHKLQKSPKKNMAIQIPSYKEPTPEPSIAETSPVHSFTHQTPDPYHQASQNTRGTSPRFDTSTIGSKEQHAADQEFSRFDQGPLDAPAFVPEDITPDQSVVAVSPPMQSAPFKAPTRGIPDLGAPSPADEPAHTPAPAPAPAPYHAPSRATSRIPVVPIGRSAPGPRSPASDSTSDDSADAASRDDKVLDRWAQIRKNAADRAQRLSEEQQSGRSHTTSQSAKTDADEGDTSGEETIESRVARIKARVAELTGNMEGPNAPATRR
ncbi:hypothetical protein BLS_002663 [Venturia inaequalis]|uniref:Meiotically up-regulated protein Msb1/Mug8 domain-containing protein n=1 Tax=Venturia inaequalis TaxID=5025 RepID=A0A8H3US92_VENIN|nr:hypothetical protein BLS_002663 [Venturia inaequalis]KAE9989084.1 hypothetical protein EG328_000015 [Venturia inaequalis]RDI89237.1 hypothetical protein Vi05172_g81 [Venturia inaequalis]